MRTLRFPEPSQWPWVAELETDELESATARIQNLWPLRIPLAKLR